MTQKRILFLGTHGQHNIGDELLLDTFLTQLGSENHYFVNSYDTVFTETQLRPRFQVDVFHTTAEPLRFLRYLLSADLVFFGGGSIIKELYASVGRSRYSTLLMILLTVTFARQIVRKPVIMSNIGVGPIKTTWGKRISALVLRQVDLLSVRDETSYQTCLTLGLEAKQVHQIPDVVFVNDAQALMSGPDENAEHMSSETFIEDARPVRVALNLNFDIENPANWETFLQNLEDGIRSLNDRQPIEIHALPMQSKFKTEDDLKVLTAFRQRIPEIDMHLHNPETFQEVAAIISECDLLISERLHAIVIAAILGTPCLALMYDVKVRELVSMLDIREHAVEINQPFDPERLSGQADSLLQAPATASHHLVRRTITLRGEMDAYIQLLLNRLETLTCR